MEQSIIDDLKAAHTGKELHLISIEHEETTLEVVITSPAKNQVSKYLHDLGKDDNSFTAAEHFVLACTVYPERKSLQAIFDKAPLLISTINKELEKKAGLGAKAVSSKL